MKKKKKTSIAQTIQDDLNMQGAIGEAGKNS